VAGIFIVPAEKAQDVRWAEVRRTGVKGTTKRRNQFIRSVSQKKEKAQTPATRSQERKYK
jgi:hypothetical protein